MKNLDNSLNGDTGDSRVMESSRNISRSHQHPQYPYTNQKHQDQFYYQKQQELSSTKSTPQSIKTHNLQSPQHIALLKASTMSPTVAHSNTLPNNINRSSSMSPYRNGVHHQTSNGCSNNNINNHHINGNSGNHNVLNNNLR